MKRVPLFRPSIDREEIDKVSSVLKSGWLTRGSLTEEFEKRCAEYLSAANCVAVSSATAGLHLALLALGVGPGDEVITVSLTFIATVQAILYVGAKPIFADIDPETLNISVKDVLMKVSPRTKVILPVHFGGHPCEMSELSAIARSYNLYIVEDAAHAFGASYRGKMIGSSGLGDLTVFSFYPNKPITTGEGGLVCGRKEFVERIRLLSHHGIYHPTEKYRWRYFATELGYKYNFTDIQAAIGLAQISKAKAMIDRRKKWFRMYNLAFSNEEAFLTPIVKKHVESSYHIYPLRLNLSALKCSRDEFAMALEDEGVGVSVHYFPPVHLHPYYYRTLGLRKGSLPVTEIVSESEITLPLYPDMSEEEFEFVVDRVFKVLKRFRR